MFVVEYAPTANMGDDGKLVDPCSLSCIVERKKNESMDCKRRKGRNDIVLMVVEKVCS